MRAKATNRDEQIRLRIPKAMKKIISKAAFENGRSINSEILIRLKSTLSTGDRNDNENLNIEK